MHEGFDPLVVRPVLFQALRSVVSGSADGDTQVGRLQREGEADPWVQVSEEQDEEESDADDDDQDDEMDREDGWRRH